MVVASEARAIPLSEGTYTYVGLDIDSTGRRLIDEVIEQKHHGCHNCFITQIYIFKDCSYCCIYPD